MSSSRAGLTDGRGVIGGRSGQRSSSGGLACLTASLHGWITNGGFGGGGGACLAGGAGGGYTGVHSI